MGAFFAGYTASMVGDQVWMTTLGWSASHLDDPLRAGLVMGAGTVPRALLMLLGGNLVDRLGIRRLALATQAGRVAVMTAAALVTLAVPRSWVALTVVAVVFGAIDAINLPALGAAPAMMAPPEQLPRLTGILQAAQRTATIIGAPAAGLIIATGETPAATITCTVLFALALGTFLAAHLPGRSSPTADGPKARSVDPTGIRYVLGRPQLRVLAVVIACLNFTVMGCFNVGLPLLVELRGWTSTTYGIIEACFGAGAIAGSLALAMRRPARNPVLTAACFLAIQPPLLAAVGLVPNTVAVCVASAAVGLALGPAGSILVALIQTGTDRAYIGRVVSVVSFTSAGLTPVSYLAFAAVADIAGTPIAFVANAAIAACAAAAMFRPSSRTAPSEDTAPHENNDAKHVHAPTGQDAS
ncbi:MFS transporter [Kitasatospora aureofaciens]|uniref:MFS transporter n=1 Tax=Kitasatospora aureofaciens TaxID=1894 RepID=UPI0033D8F5DC